MRMSLEDEIREIVKEMLKGLSSVMLFEKMIKKDFKMYLKQWKKTKKYLVLYLNLIKNSKTLQLLWKTREDMIQWVLLLKNKKGGW